MIQNRTPLILLLALLLAALPVAAHAAAEVAKPYGGESPEALVERLKSAAENEDFAGLAACLAPDDRATLALTLTMITGMVMAFAGMAGAMGGEEAAAEMAEQMAGFEEDYEAILERYGVDEGTLDSSSGAGEEADAAELLAGVDQVGLIGELMGLIQSLPGEEQPNPGDEMDLPAGELEDLQVDGDQATGRVGDETVEFVRVDGRWYLSLGLEAEGLGMQGMAPGAP